MLPEGSCLFVCNADLFEQFVQVCIRCRALKRSSKSQGVSESAESGVWQGVQFGVLF